MKASQNPTPASRRHDLLRLEVLADQPILDAHPEIWTMVFEGTPLQIGTRLYVSTSLNQVAALPSPADLESFH